MSKLRDDSLIHMRALVQSMLTLVSMIETRDGEILEDDLDWLASDMENLQGIYQEMTDIFYAIEE